MTSTMRLRGTLIQNAHRHVPTSTSIEPSAGPSAVAMPPIPAHVAIADARRLTGMSASITATADGVMSVQPSACTTRAAISAEGFGDSAQAAAATVKTAKPVSSARLRPKRAHTTAERISVAPETIVYPLSTHDNCAVETSGNERRRSGNATLMIDWFNDVTKLDSDASTSTIHARREIVAGSNGASGNGRARTAAPRSVVIVAPSIAVAVSRYVNSGAPPRRPRARAYRGE